MTLYISFHLLIQVLATITTLSDNKESVKTYSVNKIPSDLVLTGKGDDLHWTKAKVLTDFSYPWEGGNPLPTKFRALHNDDWLYCLFEITDPNVNIRQKTNDKSEVASSSRAEIFFKVNDRLQPYYCLEIDPLGRVMDYKGHHYRKFDLTWTWKPGHLVVRTSRSKDGYSIELALSKRSLKELDLLTNNILQAGLYRADCVFDTHGDPAFKWISWVKPESATPDFHIASSFGILRLEDKT